MPRRYYKDRVLVRSTGRKITILAVIYIVSLMGLLFYAHIAHANEAPNGWDKGNAVASAHQNDAMSALQKSDPHDIPHYTDNPSQSGYYGGEKQSDASAMENASVDAALNTASGQTTISSFNNRPWISVDKNSSTMKQSEHIVNDAHHIANGVSDDYADCSTTTSNCKTTYTTQTCQAPKDLGTQTCTSQLVVNVQNPVNFDEIIKVTASHYFNEENSHAIYEYSVALSNGSITPNDDNVSINAIMGDTTSHANLSYKGTSNMDEMVLPYVDIIQQPSKSNGYTFIFALRDSRKEDYSAREEGIVFNFHYTTNYEPTTTETWTNDCDGLDELVNENVCTLTSSACTDTTPTKTINGVTVSEGCWQKKKTYDCSHNNSVQDTCSSLKEEGCSQTSSVCSQEVDGICVAYQNTYQCTKQTCESTSVVCGEQTYCMDGNCTDKSYTPSSDFETAMSSLNADVAAEDEYSLNTIFKGSPMTCSDKATNYSNCCADSGWGQDIHLAKCSNAEKELGQKKQKHLTIYVGRYCAKKIFGGVCTEYRKAYCVFPGVLDKIVQEQGRQDQLHISFGSPDVPNCSGLSPDQLGEIDYSKINWEEYYDTLYQNTDEPDTGAESSKINQEVNSFYNTGSSHD